MIKAIVTILIVIGIAFAFASGITPSYLVSAPGVASGIGAKLLCSSVYVSGFSEQQARDDLTQYSPILRRLNVQFDHNLRQVHTSFYGMSPTTATYVDGIGCANDYTGFTQRAELQTTPLPVFSSRWPHGNRVETINNPLQQLTHALVAQDNASGFNTRALLVVHNGNIVAESYAQGADETTPLLGWSMAKSLMSIMLGNLEYRGHLRIDEPAGFASWQDDQRRHILMKHLLTMTDGLDFSEQYDPGEDATAMLFTQASASDYVISRALAHEPGTHFNYSSGTANLLSRIHFERTGATLASSLQDYREHIAVPLSFQHAVFETDASGVLMGSSYFYASARDWARMGQLMLNKGVLNGARVVSEDWVTQSTTPNQSLNEQTYGFQWWLNADGKTDYRRWPQLPDDAYSASGNRQQFVMIVPSADTVVVRLGWTSGSYPIAERVSQIISALN